MKSPNWTKNELVLAFNLYLKLPFGKMHSNTHEVRHLAQLLNRTSGSIAMRLTNFASVDPYHQLRGVGGLSGGKKQVQPIWDEFIDKKGALIFESEKILAELEHKTIESKFSELLTGTEHLKGEDKVREVRVRVNQQAFRQIVLANYVGKCAITSINIPDLLVASHIIPWSKNEQERLNPENGICFSALCDKAFDKGLIGINERLEVVVSPTLKPYKREFYYAKYFSDIGGSKLSLPQKYLPKKEFLQYHMDEVFKR